MFDNAVAYLRQRVASGKMRKYAGFFDWPDKGIKERGVVNELFAVMRANGECSYSDARTADQDPPDCIAVDSAGNLVGIEVSELVDEDAVRHNQQGKGVYRLWDETSVIEKLKSIIRGKDGKTYLGGPYEKLILVIHMDKPEIDSKKYKPAVEKNIV